MPPKPKTATQEAKRKPGRPRTSVPLTDFDLAPRRPAPQFGSRKDTEKYVGTALAELAGEYDELSLEIAASRRALCAAIQKRTAEGKEVDGSLLRMLEQQQQRFRQVLKDKGELAGKLMKQFELFAELDRPADEDPRFAPVILSLAFDPPVEAIVDPIAELDDDDIQPRD